MMSSIILPTRTRQRERVRLVSDYKELKKFLKRPVNPFTAVSYILQLLPTETKIFAKMDANNGQRIHTPNQIPPTPGKTQIHKGLYGAERIIRQMVSQIQPPHDRGLSMDPKNLGRGQTTAGKKNQNSARKMKRAEHNHLKKKLIIGEEIEFAGNIISNRNFVRQKQIWLNLKIPDALEYQSPTQILGKSARLLHSRSSAHNVQNQTSAKEGQCLPLVGRTQRSISTSHGDSNLQNYNCAIRPFQENNSADGLFTLIWNRVCSSPRHQGKQIQLSEMQLQFFHLSSSKLRHYRDRMHSCAVGIQELILSTWTTNFQLMDGLQTLTKHFCQGTKEVGKLKTHDHERKNCTLQLLSPLGGWQNTLQSRHPKQGASILAKRAVGRNMWRG